jgi:hypothetical protein
MKLLENSFATGNAIKNDRRRESFWRRISSACQAILTT